MSALPVRLENDIRDGLYSTLNSSESSPPYTGLYELPEHDASLFYKFSYYNYHHMGEVKHGVEVVFKLRDADSLVSSDINAIEDSLTQIVNSILSHNERINLEYEDTEYVFIEEIMHSFGEQT